MSVAVYHVEVLSNFNFPLLHAC